MKSIDLLYGKRTTPDSSSKKKRRLNNCKVPVFQKRNTGTPVRTSNRVKILDNIMHFISKIFHLKRTIGHHIVADDSTVTKRTGFFVSPVTPYDKSEFLKWYRSCTSDLVVAFLYKAKKNYLRAVAEELGIEVTEKKVKLKIIETIMASEHFEEQFVLNMMEEEEEMRKEKN
ncbi:hypothetical protein AVEN_193340-1 [Araneus ventricosus]|uniref:Uncharacterized protein n=1 Tax=Araneus ventricosus TaxID=182803 RepID=A0A4Y2ESQ9_ARAVE|nr:hypothetical protein AVEN_193340-1 [Araneus ventricosus]